MKKVLLLLIAVITTSVTSAQVDQIFKHNGEVVKGAVKRVEEYTVVFVYEGEEAEYTIGKYAVEKIIHSSGREEEVSEKIVINNPKEDWEKVVILEDKSYIAGLKKGGNVRGKTGLINFQSGNTGDRKAEKKLKIAAAKLGCPFILLTADKSTVGSSSNALGGSQNIKKGIGYKYK
ncbi:hypothetical protein [Lacinutrix salivirga]